jgi:hypothetical protein
MKTKVKKTKKNLEKRNKILLELVGIDKGKPPFEREKDDRY